MRTATLFLLVVAALPFSGAAQSQQDTLAIENNSFYSPLFGWHIDIPPGYEEVEPAVWDLQKGLEYDALNDSDTTQVDNPRTIVALKSNEYHYLEANWKTFNADERGSFETHVHSVNQQMYDTFAAQLPEAKIDTASSTQQVSGLSFYRFVLRIELPNGIILNSQMFTRLFGTHEFAANIFYVNEEHGRLLNEAWLYSRFDND